jgi:hypothetical protein
MGVATTKQSNTNQCENTGVAILKRTERIESKIIC